MKKIAVFCLVLLVVCSYAFAFEGMGKALSGSSKESAKEPVETPVVKEESPKVAEVFSSLVPEKMSNPASTALNDLSDKKSLNKKDLEAHRANLEAVAADVDMLIADAEAIHPFFNTGLKLSFEDGYPVFGTMVGGGAKFGTTGIMASGYLSYDFVTLKKGFQWHKDNFLKNFGATIMIGYEF